MKNIASKIMKESFSSEKNNGNKLEFIEGNQFIYFLKNIKNKIVTPAKSDIKLLELFQDYIYGLTPLYTTLNLSFDAFRTQSDKHNHKYLFIISDGELTDVDNDLDYIREIRNNAEENNILIISIFLTSNDIPIEEKLYDTYQEHFSQGSKDLFSMSSILNYENPIIKFFIKKGWDIPISGECKLFVEINDSKNLNKFIELFNEAISEFNFINNNEVKTNPNSLISILGSTAINEYVSSNIINNYKAKEQKGGTCYANAIAAGIYISSAKVLGISKLNFFNIRKDIIDIYDKGEGGNTFEIMEEYLINYRLHSQIVDEEGARRAIMKTNPCVAKFRLTDRQWKIFEQFYKNNPGGILTKEIINQENKYPNEKTSGHAVVLTHISKDYLKFLNSWGKKWGDNGYFKIKNAEVLNVKFSEIFWEISDLTPEEINYYNEYIENLKKGINQKIFD